MQNLFLSLMVLAFSSSSFGAIVALIEPNQMMFYGISSAVVTADGVQILANDTPVCLASTEFLNKNHLEGSELVKQLSNKDYDVVVECKKADVAGKFLAEKIRPRITVNSKGAL